MAARQARETDDATLVARLQKALETRPDDLVGHRLLAQSLAGLDRWPEAAAAQAQVLAILGDQATASDLVDLAEAQIIAAGGFVHPEAATTLQRALTLDPQDPAGRYYAALADLQAGRVDAAYRTWSTLVADGPPDAPWIAPARAGMAEAQRLASAPPGPSAADLAAAEDMPPAERQAMIQAMVDQLSDRLAREGGPPEDWARLVRSLGVLDRRGDAAAILAEARQAYANDGAAQATPRRRRRRRGDRPVTAAILADPAAFAAALPPRRALMGLDLGTRTIGVAVSDTFRRVATPLETIRRTRFGEDAAALLALATPRAIGGLVLGLPRNMDGSEGPRAQSTRAFARNLSGLTDLPITFWDERLSTVAAERALLEADASRRRRAEVIDHVAAGYILQGFLDRLGHLEREA